MKQKSILYLDKPGRGCVAACVQAAAQRAAALGISHAVVATTSGRTALDLAVALKRAGARTKVVGVGYAANFAAKWGRLDAKLARRAEELGAVFITGGHAFGGVNSAMQEKLGGLSPNKIVAETYYTLGQGFKVAVEVALMAADQRRLPVGRETLALGGTGKGADTALILTPACSAEFFDLRIHEIVCMPR